MEDLWEIGVYAIMAAFLATFSVVYTRTKKKEALRRERQVERNRACLSCGSPRTETTRDVRRCLACGYEGRADGGGALTAEDMGGMFDIDRRE